jgi:hypothetical protein
METVKLSNPATERENWLKYRKWKCVVICNLRLTFNDLSIQSVEGCKRLDVA